MTWRWRRDLRGLHPPAIMRALGVRGFEDYWEVKSFPAHAGARPSYWKVQLMDVGGDPTTKTQAEMVTSVRRRRRWSRAEKERIVAAAMEPGAVAGGGRSRGRSTSEPHWRCELRPSYTVGPSIEGLELSNAPDWRRRTPSDPPLPCYTEWQPALAVSLRTARTVKPVRYQLPCWSDCEGCWLRQPAPSLPAALLRLCVGWSWRRSADYSGMAWPPIRWDDDPLHSDFTAAI